MRMQYKLSPPTSLSTSAVSEGFMLLHKRVQDTGANHSPAPLPTGRDALSRGGGRWGGGEDELPPPTVFF